MKVLIMKSFKITIIFLLVFVSIQRSAQAELSHIQTLACETILCLSSAVQPAECNPALSYFYGIEGDKLSDTLNLRRKFLNKCPDSSAPGMPTLISAIVNYSSPFCTIEGLNNNKINVIVEYGSRFRPKSKHIRVVSPKMPSSCRRYYDDLINHEYTAYKGLTYVGRKINGKTYTDEDGHKYIVIRGSSHTAQELLKNHWEWVE